MYAALLHDGSAAEHAALPQHQQRASLYKEDSCSGAAAALRSLVTDACMPLPLQYVLHFPRTEKYVSVLKAAPDAAAQEQLEAERARLRGLVRQHLAEVAMLTQGDEGRSTLGGQHLPARSPPQASPLSGAPLSGAKRKQAEVGHTGTPVDLPSGCAVLTAPAAVRYHVRA